MGDKTNQDFVIVPVDLKKDNGNIFVVSLKLPRQHYKDPFFVDSLARYFDIKSQIKLPSENELLARPIHYDPQDKRVILTPVDEFISKNIDNEIDKKLGYIFHISRCGSTLAAQMLAASSRFFVLSEPTIVNAVLDPALPVSQKDRGDLLKSVIKNLIGCAPDTCEWVFVKFRSWNTLFMEFILDIFPEARWMFIHRNGLEVFPSVIEKPPGWLRSRNLYAEYFSDLLHVDRQSLQAINQDEYVARIIGEFCKTANKLKSERSLFVDYINLTNNFIYYIKKSWDINLTDKERKDVENVMSLYSKDVNKKMIFRSDSELKKAKASHDQIELINKFVESIRIKLL